MFLLWMSSLYNVHYVDAPVYYIWSIYTFKMQFIWQHISFVNKLFNKFFQSTSEHILLISGGRVNKRWAERSVSEIPLKQPGYEGPSPASQHCCRCRIFINTAHFLRWFRFPPQMSTPRIESYFLWYLLPLKFPITVISKCCMCEILKFIHYWLQNPIQGCQSLSVYSGSGYIDSKCYDEKQVDLAIKSNCYYSYSLKQQAIVHLFEWHWDWIADECEKVTKSLSWNLIIFFKIEGWGIFQSIELPSQCARFLDQRDSVEYRCLPQQSMFRWILRFNFCTFFLFAPLLPPLNQLSSMFEQGGQWWTRYQPVSYKLESRFQIWRRKSLQNNRKKA